MCPRDVVYIHVQRVLHFCTTSSLCRQSIITHDNCIRTLDPLSSTLVFALSTTLVTLHQWIDRRTAIRDKCLLNTILGQIRFGGYVELSVLGSDT